MTIPGCGTYEGQSKTLYNIHAVTFTGCLVTFIERRIYVLDEAMLVANT